MPNPRDSNLPPYSKEDLEKAVSEVKKGKSVRSVAKKRELPKSTLYDHSRGRYQDPNMSRPDPNKTLSAEEESALCQYIIYMADRGFPLTRKMIAALVVAIVMKSGRETLMNPDRGPSKKWMRRFLKRHPKLAERRPDNLDRARAEVTQEEIGDYFELLQRTVDRLDIGSKPSSVFNCDETGFSGKETYKGKVVVKRGAKHAYQQSMKFTGHTTVHMAASADGKIIPPLIIFEKCLPRNPTDGIPSNWCISSTASGYITTDLFLAWFRDVFLQECGKDRPLLLIMDNHISHLSPDVITLAQENNVELLCLPPHSTHLLQPLDKGYFNLLKANMADVSLSLGYSGARSLPREKFPKVLEYAMSNIAASKVKACFQGTGIYPLDPSAVVNPIQEAPAEETPTPGTSSETRPVTEEENVLVKLGLIPAALKDILVPPPKPKERAGKKKKIHGARVITCDQPSVKKSKADEEKESTCMDGDTETNVAVEVEEEQLTDTLCVVCMMGYVRGFNWIGCDLCTNWYHYECLPSDQQTLVDLSIVVGDNWACHQCALEE